VDHEALVTRLCQLAEEAGRQLAADTECIAELRAELDDALEQLERTRAERDRALARLRRLEAGRAA
jgi:hypothetical protein